MAITTSGVGSGIDIKSLVQQLVAAEGQPVATRLSTKEAKYQAQLSALGSLKGAMSGFQSALSGLTSASSFGKRTAASSDSTLFTASATSAAVAGSYRVEVTQLAQAHTLRSEAVSSSTSAVGTGTLTFQFGDATKPAQTVTINSGNDSLEGIRDAVNAAKIGVQASIIKGSDGYHLVFASASSGLDNSLKVTVVESPANGTNTDRNGLSQLAYDPAAAVGDGKNMVQTVEAKDATVNINGIEVTSATNTVSDAIDGISLTLNKAAIGTTATLTVGLDKGAVTTAVEGFVKSYNSLMATVKSISGYDAVNKKASTLTGDATVRGITSQLRAVMNETVTGLSGYRALADIGIKTNTDGTLTLDQSKLSSALDSSFDEIGRLFAAVGTPSDSLVTYDSSTSSTKEGSYALNVSQVATRGVYLDAASSVSSLVVNGTNDTFSLKVDGIQSGTISLTNATYASGAALAAELQSRINGDSAVQAAGSAVTVGYDEVNHRFTFTSDRYGSASSVEFTNVEDVAASGVIGLTVSGTADTSGSDVAGSLGGSSASGSGQYLTGAGDAVGLKLKIEGGTGERGTVVFSRGIADKLNTLLTRMLESDSALDARTDTLNKGIDEIADQREALERRLAALEKRYTAQFTAMDTLVAQLNSTGSYLTQQLSSLSSSSS